MTNNFVVIDMSNVKNIKLNKLWAQIYIGTRSKMTKEEFLGRTLDSPCRLKADSILRDGGRSENLGGRGRVVMSE